MAKVTRENIKLNKEKRVNALHKVDRNFEIAKMYKDWTPVAKIAEEFGITRKRVYDILERYV